MLQAQQMSKSLEGMDPATLQKMMKWGIKAQGWWAHIKTRAFWIQAMMVVLVAMVIGHITGTF